MNLNHLVNALIDKTEEVLKYESNQMPSIRPPVFSSSDMGIEPHSVSFQAHGLSDRGRHIYCITISEVVY